MTRAVVITALCVLFAVAWFALLRYLDERSIKQQVKHVIRTAENELRR